jgi:thymidylate kinase
MLTDRLRKDGHKVKLIEVPIKSWLTYKLIYWMLRNGYAKTFPNVFQTVQFFNKWFFQFRLSFLRMMYDYIIFDRWSLSAVVYGDAGGANPSYNRFLYRFLREPDALLILVGAARSGEVTDVYERDTELQANVRTGYAEWYLTHQKDCAIVDNLGTRDEVHNRIMRILDERFDVL